MKRLSVVFLFFIALSAEASTHFSCMNNDQWVEDVILKFDLQEDGITEVRYFDSWAWHFISCKKDVSSGEQTLPSYRCAALLRDGVETEIFITKSNVSDGDEAFLAKQTTVSEKDQVATRWSYTCSH